jgi:diguanylate cyclase (GGDEF)-like protein
MTFDIGTLTRIASPAIVLPLALWARGGLTRVRLAPGNAREARTVAERLVPVFLSLAILSFVLAQVLATVQGKPFDNAHRTGWTQAAYIGSDLCAILGTCLLLFRPLLTVSRVRVLVDALMTVVAISTFSWYFIIGPIVLQAHASSLEVGLQAADPIANLVLIFLVLVLTGYGHDTGLRRVLPPLVASLTLIVASDSTHDYQMLHGAVRSGALLELGWLLGFLLLAVAAGASRSLRAAPSPKAETTPGSIDVSLRGAGTPAVWRYLLPYALIPGVVALMVFAASHHGDQTLQMGVYIGGALLIELVFVHQLLAYRALIAFTNKSARFESLAAADSVTGLPNQRTAIATLDQMLDRSRTQNQPCATLFLDIDHFKSINDTYGHHAGDGALREFASVVRTVLRTTDVLGRWGGEEFVALLPETDGDLAYAVAERVRTAVAGRMFRSIGGGHLTCSIGVSSYPDEACDRDTLVMLADQAMYEAKRLGRNQVRTVQVHEVPLAEASKTG